MLEEIVNRIVGRHPLLDDWFRERQGDLPPLPTVSVDIRNARFKSAVVDTNLFPAGFNNLCETFSEKASQAFRRYFDRYHPEVRKIHLYPEPHTRNLYYQENLRALATLLRRADLDVSVGLQLEAADLILLNNDLSLGLDPGLTQSSVPVVPSPKLGWHQRKKSDHFQLLGDLLHEAGLLLEIDPWFLFPLWTLESAIDLTSESCLRRLQQAADQLLERIREKYRQYRIDEEPYLFVKDNAGTYGMGILPIDSGSELLTLSRRLRNKLLSAKGGRTVNELLLQEGIPTADSLEGKPMEPLVYLVGGEPVGTFFRIHDSKTDRESLNAPGMSFSCICYHQVETPRDHLAFDRKEDLFLFTSFLGRIASLAASLESQSLAD